MKNRNGFTLTEVLLAVMVVGIIGVALASLTTAASRESGVGSSRVMLRNNLSVALRLLRQDVHGASRILFAKGPMTSAPKEDDNPNQELLLLLANNLSVLNESIDAEKGDPQFVAYCFTRGNTTTISSGEDVQPKSDTIVSYDGGKITREVWTDSTLPDASTACQADKTGRTISTWLYNVKFISNDYTYSSDKRYPSPLFSLLNFNGSTTYNNSWELTGEGALLDVKIILELPSSPVVNEVLEERVLLSNSGTLTELVEP